MGTGSALRLFQPADRWRIIKSKQLAEMLILTNYFVEMAPQFLVAPARNLTDSLLSKTFKQQKRGSALSEATWPTVISLALGSSHLAQCWQLGDKNIVYHWQEEQQNKGAEIK